MSSEEEDYMSDAFLMGCTKSDDIRPGLIHNHSERRNHEMLKKKQENDDANKMRNPSAKFVESENRETAMNKPISFENKGFAMLQKLGFKPGTGLGKSSAGRIEPISIKIKNDRQGLGLAEAQKESAAMKTAAKKEANQKLMNIDNYRSHLAEKTVEKRALVDLRKSQRVCKHLDTDSGATEPDESWYWPDYIKKESDDNYDADDGDNDNVDKTYQAVNDENEEDDEVEDEDENEEYDDSEEYTVKEKLQILTHYLRKTHYYCIWCAVQFDDDRDLEKECPGSTYQDH